MFKKSENAFIFIKVTVTIGTSLIEYRYYKNVADQIPAQRKMTSSCFRSDNASMKLFSPFQNIPHERTCVIQKVLSECVYFFSNFDNLFFLADEGIQIPLKAGHHWQFRWRANDGPTLYAGLVAL